LQSAGQRLAVRDGKTPVQPEKRHTLARISIPASMRAFSRSLG
jgi:hypothetical protein